MKKIVLFFILLWSHCICVCAQYLVPKSEGVVVKHSYYTLSYDEKDEQPYWVFYKLTPRSIKGGAQRSNNFRYDPMIKTHSATKEDYYKSGYDRGHLCPAADMKLNAKAMSETFYMSNMSPQVPGFNRGIWRVLEEKVRNWALHRNELYIVSGPIFKDNKGKIGADDVTVPGYYFKIVYDPSGNKRMIAFILPNEKSNLKLSSFVTSVDEVEKMTHIDFFSDLNDSEEILLERESHIEEWVL